MLFSKMISEKETYNRDRLQQSRMTELLQRNETRNKRIRQRLTELENVKQKKTWVNPGFAAASSLLSNLRAKDDAENNERNVDFYLTSMKLLESLVKDEKTKSHITKFLSVASVSPKETTRFLQTERIVRKFQHQHMRIISWPSVVEGIMHQFDVDIPRCSFSYKGQTWNDPSKLYYELKWDFGPIWSRWICLFSNQAPLADVLKMVEERAKETIPSLKKRDFVVMELNAEILRQFSNYNLDVDKARNAIYSLTDPQVIPIVLKIEKILMIAHTSCFEKSPSSTPQERNVWICHTTYCVQFLPDLKIEINVNFIYFFL